MKKNLFLIKLGGSLITDKTKPYVVRSTIINQVASDLKTVIHQSKDTHFIIGNGAGSFGHYAASIENKNTPYGFAFIQQKVKELNTIITASFVKEKIPCYSIPMSSIAVSDKGKIHSLYMDTIEQALINGLLPSIYGDVVLDKNLHTHIFSTEDIFSALISYLSKDYENILIVHLTTVEGFMDQKGKVIKVVTHQNYENLQNNLTNVRGFDVTGGMKHKIEESLKLAKKGIVTTIVNGNDPHILQRLIIKKEAIGTRIC